MSQIYILLMGNSLESCIEDVKIMENIFNKDSKKYIIQTCFNCNPQKELIHFLNIYSKLFKKEDILYMHYSGHGKLIGKRINNKLEIISTWVNPDGTNTYSNTIDKILSNVKCQIILTSDSCHSGNFGKFYTGTSSYLFIGSSSSIEQSYEYIIHNSKKIGCLTGLFEYVFKNKYIDMFISKSVNIKIVETISINFFKKHNIKIKPIIKYFNNTHKYNNLK